MSLKETLGSGDEKVLFVLTGSQSMRDNYHSDCYVIVTINWGFANQLRMRNKECIVWNEEDNPLKMEISIKLRMP